MLPLCTINSALPTSLACEQVTSCNLFNFIFCEKQHCVESESFGRGFFLHGIVPSLSRLGEANFLDTIRVCFGRFFSLSIGVAEGTSGSGQAAQY